MQCDPSSGLHMWSDIDLGVLHTQCDPDTEQIAYVASLDLGSSATSCSENFGFQIPQISTTPNTHTHTDVCGKGSQIFMEGESRLW